ncbi:MAG: hypothetical protein Q9M28_03835 [Mariprofundaceae bacterium]|nr:hypothetical protein [Mariprofundaceae bacterium]
MRFRFFMLLLAICLLCTTPLVEARGSRANIAVLDAETHQQSIYGNFLHPGSQTPLELHWQLDPNKHHYRGLSIQLEQRIVLIVSSRKSILKLRLVGIARSSHNHMDQIVLLAKYGKTWPEEVIFISYDGRRRQFVQYYVSSQYSDAENHPYLRCNQYQTLIHTNPFQPCLSLWESAGHNAFTGERMFRELRPIKALANRRRSRSVLTTRLIPTAKIEKVIRQIKAMRDPNFYIETLDENSSWEILLISFDSPDRGSWGLLFGFNKQKQQWMSFYELPKSSMVSLFMPVVDLINQSTLKLNTCVDCRMWGKKSNIIVNLDTMVASISRFDSLR